MKKAILLLSFIVLSSFNSTSNIEIKSKSTISIVIGEFFSLINDSKDKISIHTETGFVSLNKGSKTSLVVILEKKSAGQMKVKKEI
jgi:hypothetical protein